MSREMYIKEDAELDPLSDGERLTILVNMWPSLMPMVQANLIRMATCFTVRTLPEPDSELAAVLSIWPTLSTAQRLALLAGL